MDEDRDAGHHGCHGDPAARIGHDADYITSRSVDIRSITTTCNDYVPLDDRLLCSSQASCELIEPQ